MKIYVMYDRDVNWERKQLDTTLLLYQGEMNPNGGVYVFDVKTLSDLGYVLEAGKALYVLREPMELGSFTKLEDVVFNVDYVINSSKILFVTPMEAEQVDEPTVDEVTVDQYLNEEEKKKRMKMMANHGRPR